MAPSRLQDSILSVLTWKIRSRFNLRAIMVEDMPKGQAQNTETHNSNQERYYKVYADIGERFLAFISGEDFALIAARVITILTGTMLPKTGHASMKVLACLLNRSEVQARRILKELKAKPVYVTGEAVYDMGTLPDLAKTSVPPVDTEPE